jgi:NAD(P)-dependent dehydrogenase (short-subunit alcohol dehydrogenase family)
MELKGKVALVMGGGSGIGRAASLVLARNGAAVVVGDLEVSRAEGVSGEIEVAGGRSVAEQVDVTASAEVSAVVKRALDRFSAIDILVNSAGIYPWSTVSAMAEEEWDRVIAVNLKGPFLACKAVLPHMIARKQGRIINISAGHGARGVVHGAHYCASKAGVNALTKSLALEGAPHGVLVNAIAPGPIDTPLPRGGRQYSDEEKKTIGASLPLGRMGRPEEIAQTVLFLSSDVCQWMTGQILYHNGGDLMMG